MNHDPHENEYLAAIAGLPQQTISPPRALDGHAIGDRIAFRLEGWGPRSFDAGRVIDIKESLHRLLVETDEDIVEVDPRPWPEGHVLPF